MTSTLNFYSVASSAARGAKRAGVANAVVFQMNDGKHTYIDADNLPEDLELALVAHNSNLDTVAPEIVLDLGARLKAANDAKKAAENPAPVAAANGAAVELPKPGEVVVPVSTRSSYKELARRSPSKSTVANPVDIVWAFVADNPTMPRKQAITALVNLGINLATVKTQYQKAKSGKARFKTKDAK